MLRWPGSLFRCQGRSWSKGWTHTTGPSSLRGRDERLNVVCENTPTNSMLSEYLYLFWGHVLDCIAAVEAVVVGSRVVAAFGVVTGVKPCIDLGHLSFVEQLRAVDIVAADLAMTTMTISQLILAQMPFCNF